MAATEDAERGPASRDSRPGALMAAALALPGILPATAHAQSAPDQGVVQFVYIDYRDWQPQRARMYVHNPSLYALIPVSDSVVVEGSVLYDAVTGASPLYFNVLSGPTVGDYRTAGDVRVTKYFGDYAVTVGGAISSEQDFLSRAASMNFQFYSADRNTTYALGFAYTYDVINPTNDVVSDERRHSLDFLVGITQNLSAQTIVQSNVTYYSGRGYYSDPYKPLDTRPNSRRITAWLTRLNHYVPEADGTLKFGYRLLFDSFGSTSNMLEVAWNQGLPQGWSVQPLMRYYTQSAASFYMNPPFPIGFVEGQDYSADTRLAAFGAFTLGLTVNKLLPEGWNMGLRYDFYRQDPAWRLGGNGSPGIETFSARWFEVSVSKAF